MQARASPKERFGHGFDYPGLAGAGGSQEEQVANRTSRRIQPSQKHLIDFHDFFDGGILADNFAAKGAFELSGIVAAEGRVKHGAGDGFHKVVWP